MRRSPGGEALCDRTPLIGNDRREAMRVKHSLKNLMFAAAMP